MVKDESALSIPPEWQEKFLIKRIGEEDIEITLIQRNFILKAFSNGDNFIQIGKYTLMVNSIKSIDPYYEPNNIPPRPTSDYIMRDGMSVDKNAKAITEWEKWYSKRIDVNRQKTTKVLE